MQTRIVGKGSMQNFNFNIFATTHYDPLSASAYSECFFSSSFSGRSYSKTLQQAPLSLLPRRHCEQHFRGAFTSRMLCAGSTHPERRVDSCRGDSGGPLVCERPGGGWVVYGVTSWGHACRTQQSPGVYTKVSAFSLWIQKVIGRTNKPNRQEWCSINSDRWPPFYPGRHFLSIRQQMTHFVDLLWMTCHSVLTWLSTDQYY